jgi:hypothetical protein
VAGPVRHVRKCVVPHDVLCTAPDCFFALLILTFNYQVLMLARIECAALVRATPIPVAGELLAHLASLTFSLLAALTASEARVSRPVFR